METAKQNFRIQQWISLLSVILFAAKIIAYYSTHSLSILSDALESIVNVIAGFIGLYSLYIVSKPRDEAHPYGHGKAEFISAAAEGALITSAGLLIIYDTLQNLIQQKAIEKIDTGLALIAATAFINYTAGFFCERTGKKNNSLALQSSGKHLKLDTYSTIVIIAALIIMYFTHLLWIDKVVALFMGCFVIFNGYKIIRKSIAGIMDEADMELLKKIISLLNSNRLENWIDLHNLRVIKYGAILHIDCHLTVPWYLNVIEAHHEIDKLIALIKKEFGDSVEMFVHTDPCLHFSCPICSKQNCAVRQHLFQQKIEWTLNNVISNKKHRLN